MNVGLVIQNFSPLFLRFWSLFLAISSTTVLSFLSPVPSFSEVLKHRMSNSRENFSLNIHHVCTDVKHFLANSKQARAAGFRREMEAVKNAGNVVEYDPWLPISCIFQGMG